MIFNVGILGGFVFLATGLTPKQDVAGTALGALIFYLALGGFMRLAATASSGEQVSLTPAWVLEQSLTWPSYLATYFTPLL